MTFEPDPQGVPDQDTRILIFEDPAHGQLASALAGWDVAISACDFDNLEDELAAGVGAILIDEACLGAAEIEQLYHSLEDQPRWADLPVMLACLPEASAHRRQLLKLLPQVLVMQWPFEEDFLQRTVNRALSIRSKQYEMRDYMMQRDEVINALQDANATRDEFLSLVSHELRTPASTILGGAKLLRSRGATLTDADKDELLASMDEEAERLCAMIENLLLLSRTGGTSVDLREPLMLQHAIRKGIEAYKRSNATRQINYEFDPELPPVVFNADLFQHVLSNLLSNAEKYSPQSTPIDIGTSPEGRGIVLFVADQGPGVAAEELELIFDRFYRTVAGTKTTRGMGLGLTVCRTLVHSQDGEIWASQRPGGGFQVNWLLLLSAD